MPWPIINAPSPPPSRKESIRRPPSLSPPFSRNGAASQSTPLDRGGPARLPSPHGPHHQDPVRPASHDRAGPDGGGRPADGARHRRPPGDLGQVPPHHPRPPAASGAGEERPRPEGGLPPRPRPFRHHPGADPPGGGGAVAPDRLLPPRQARPLPRRGGLALRRTRFRTVRADRHLPGASALVQGGRGDRPGVAIGHPLPDPGGREARLETIPAPLPVPSPPRRTPGLLDRNGLPDRS